MAIAFSRSMRSLRTDSRSRRPIWTLLFSITVLALWLGWFLGARITRFEVSNSARLEVLNRGLRIFAEFSPGALGRITAGQAARLTLQGFPPVQYGSIPARVVSAGNEVHDGRVRVELDLDRAVTSIPLLPGMPGTVEVLVENVSPAVLVLRAAGQLVGPPRSFNRQAQ